jgi:hypothetical protein
VLNLFNEYIFKLNVSNNAIVSHGKFEQLASSKHIIAPFDILGKKTSKAFFVGS